MGDKKRGGNMKWENDGRKMGNGKKGGGGDRFVVS